jgi:hypothetical protein
LAALVLGFSETLVVFELTPSGGEVLQELTAADRHGYAQLVLSGLAIAAITTVVLTGSKPAARVVAIAGVIALAIFLIIDLRHVNEVGPVNEPIFFVDAKAVPATGFWLEMAGSIALALGGATLATMTVEQLEGIRARFSRRRGEPESVTTAAERSEERRARRSTGA